MVVYPTLFPTDPVVSGSFFTQGKKRVFRTHAEGLIYKANAELLPLLII